MTADEKRKQRVEIQIDLEDAEEHLANLQVKANRHADILNTIATKLRTNASLRPSSRDFTVEGDMENRLTPGQQDSMPDRLAIQKVIEELKMARQKVHNLEQQKNQLGYHPSNS
jgi:hypothetical protein